MRVLGPWSVLGGRFSLSGVGLGRRSTWDWSCVLLCVMRKIKNARCSKNTSCIKKARCRMNGVPPAGEELGGSMSMGVHGLRLPVL